MCSYCGQSFTSSDAENNRISRIMFSVNICEEIHEDCKDQYIYNYNLKECQKCNFYIKYIDSVQIYIDHHTNGFFHKNCLNICLLLSYTIKSFKNLKN